jgi:hypothetical protein
MKERFLAEYVIVNMNNKSLTVENKKTHQMCFIHRNAFNQLDKAEDYREVERVFEKNGHEMRNNWIEVLVWKTL